MPPLTAAKQIAALSGREAVILAACMSFTQLWDSVGVDSEGSLFMAPEDRAPPPPLRPPDVP